MTNKSQGITQEYAETVAFSLLNAYYNLLNSNPADLFRFYSSGATVTHGSLSQPLALSQTGQGTIKIKDLLSRSELKGCKVMVKHAEIQPCLGDNILVVVLGEMALGVDSPSIRYVQSFLIAPGSKPGVYDIANDVIRFDPDEEEDEEEDVEAEEKATEGSSKSTDAITHEMVGASEAEATAEVKVEATARAAVETGVVQEGKPERTNTISAATVLAQTEPIVVAAEAEGVSALGVQSVVAASRDMEAQVASTEVSSATTSPSFTSPPLDSTPETSLLETSILEASPSEASSSEAFPSETSPSEASPSEAPVAVFTPLSWASKVASTAKVTDTPTTVTKRVVVAPTKDELEDGFPKRVPLASKLIVNQQKLPSNEWFPIYIRGIVTPLGDDELKRELEARFGNVTNLVISGKIALVDFANAVDQRKALDCGELKVGGNLLKLEVRTKRTAPSFKKPEFKKEVKKEEKPKPNGFKPVVTKKKAKKAE